MFLQPVMLFGLAALSIPIIIHLLNRRRYEVVDWGAMRFLQMSKVTRRRVFIEELLLMLLRMALLAFLVLAFARLVWGGDWLAWMEPRPSRDVVFIFDGSSSMNYTGEGKTPQDAAKEWAAEYIKGLAPGDRVAVLQARQQVLEIVAEPSRDLQHYVPDSIRDMPRPYGGCDLPRAVEAADAILAKSKRGERDVIVLSDGQAFGWSDGDTRQRWKNLADHIHAEKPRSDADPAPRLWVVNVDPKRDPDPPNWSLTPIRFNDPFVPVGREVAFRADIMVRGNQKDSYKPPHDVRLEVDGEKVMSLKAPPESSLVKGEIPLDPFTYKFTKAGTHLVSLILEPDAPGGTPPRDALPDDNRQDLAVEVAPPLPVVIVDGDPDSDAKTRGAWSLRDALAPKTDPTPAVQVRVVSIHDFNAAAVTGDQESGRPRVLILCNVAGLSELQQKAVEQFVANGGGVLATLGNRADAGLYNGVPPDEKNQTPADRMGLPWLPAKLVKAEGDESRPDEAAHPETVTVSAKHPELGLFSNESLGGLRDASFPRWWSVDPSDRGNVGANFNMSLDGTDAGERVATLKSSTAEFPFLVERRYKAGRVLLCTVPLDDSWGATLTNLPAFVVLAHELVYYLADARSVDLNLQPGQPIRYRLASDAPPQGFRLQPPVGPEKPLSIGPPTLDAFAAQMTPSPHPTLVCDETREAGVYRLTTPEGRTVLYVSQPDPRESDLAAGSDADRAEIAKTVPMQYESDPEKILTFRKAPDRADEWGPIFLVGMIVLLCGEVWMTRRMVKNRS